LLQAKGGGIFASFENHLGGASPTDGVV